MPDSTTRDLSIIILVLFGAALFLVGFTYFYSRDRYGQAIARLIIPRRLGWYAFVLLSGIGAYVFYSNLSSAILHLVMFATLALFGGSIAWSWLRRRQPQSSLLDLGAAAPSSQAAIVILSISSFLIFILALSSTTNRDTLLFLGSFVLLLALSAALGSRSRNLLTADHLYYRQSLIRWARIKRVIWTDLEKDPVLLIVQITGRLFPYDLEEIQIPASQHAAAADIIAQHVSAQAMLQPGIDHHTAI